MINPALDERKYRIERVKKMLENLVPIEYSKAMSVIMINTGVREATAREYIRVILGFGDFAQEDGIIKKPNAI